MTKIVTLLLFGLSGLSLCGQDFAPVGAEWYYDETFAFSGDSNYIKFTSVRDVQINGETCREITKRHKLVCNDRPDVEYLFTRNDTVFFLDTLFNTFQILYDFNAVAGSSWIIRTQGPGIDIDTLTVYVDSVSFTPINGHSLKTLHVTYFNDDDVNWPPSYNSTIIEKIGDVHYMFNWYARTDGGCDGNYSNGLRCYQDSSLGLYSTGLTDSCNHVYNDNISLKEEQASTFQMLPNPAHNYVKILFEEQVNYTVDLLSLDGKVLFSERVSNSTSTLNLNSIQSGVYIIRVYDENRLIGIEKLMKE